MASNPTVGSTSKENLLGWMQMGADGVPINNVAWAKEILQAK